jgi:outer membrane protein assembly factor BamA
VKRIAKLMHTRSSLKGARLTLSFLGYLGFLVLVFAPTTAPLRSQQVTPGVSYEGQPVVAVHLVARPTVNLEIYRALVVQQAGKPYSDEQIQKSIAALQATGQFSKVDLNVAPEARGLRLEFILEPAYYLGVLNFPGATQAFSYSQLRQVVNYPDKEPYEKSRVDSGTVALDHFFSHSGYFAAQVEPETVLDQDRRLATVIYHVTLGQRARCGQVQITGPSAEEIDHLQRALGSIRARLRGANMKPGLRYDPQRMRAAISFLQRELGKQNHLASEVRLAPPQYDPESNRANVAFQVTVGPTVVVHVTGARVSKRTLKKLLPIYEENSVDLDLVEAGRRNLISHFQAKGYFDVTATPHFAREPAQTTLDYAVTRGNKHRVVRVAITGTRHFGRRDLQSQIVVKEARFFSHGKFSQDLLNTSVKNLQAFYSNAGFEDVTVTPRVVDHDPKVDVTFDITEGPQTLVDSFEIEGNAREPLSVLAPNGLQISKGKPYSQYRLGQDRNQIVAAYLNKGYPKVAFRSTANRLTGDSHRVAVLYSIQEGPQVHISQVTYVGQERTRRELIARTTGVHAGEEMSEGDLLAGEGRLYNQGIFDWADVSPRRQITDQKSEEVLVRVHEAKRNSVAYGFGFELTPTRLRFFK